jgi:hypothetical protein
VIPLNWDLLRSQHENKQLNILIRHGDARWWLQCCASDSPWSWLKEQSNGLSSFSSRFSWLFSKSNNLSISLTKLHIHSMIALLVHEWLWLVVGLPLMLYLSFFHICLNSRLNWHLNSSTLTLSKKIHWNWSDMPTRCYETNPMWMLLTYLRFYLFQINLHLIAA